MKARLKSRGSTYIVIDAEKCKGCGFCVVFCPKKLIGRASRFNSKSYLPAEVIQVKAAECSGCGVCYLMCPDVAITVCSIKN